MDNAQYRKEVEEAIAAADNALYYLQKADESLKSAGNWGIWDMIGGGFISTMVKHSKMDEAERNIEMARNAIQNFSKEMKDIGHVTDTYIDVGSFLRFADYFFDGLIADWMVQSKIDQAREQVFQAVDQINDIKRQLKQML